MTNRQNRFNEELQRLIITALNEDETVNNHSNILHNIEFMFTQPTRSSPYSSSYYYGSDTSNNNTDTSNNNTDTSNNNTDTSNNNTDTSNNNTDTDTSNNNTDTSNNNTDTDTSNNNTDTDTSNNNTDTINNNNANRNIRQRNNRRNTNNLELLMNNYSRSFSIYQSQITEYQNMIRLYIENYGENEYTINQPRSYNRTINDNLHTRETINIPSSISRTFRTENLNIPTNINNYDNNTSVSGLFSMYPDSIVNLLYSVGGLLYADSSNNTHETSTNQLLPQEFVENIINLNSSVFKFNYENYQTSDVCPISLEPFVEDEEVVKFNICGHMFKKPLIVNWLTRHNKCCPVCRRMLSTNISSNETNNDTAEDSESEVEIDLIFN